jgi:hypothetical protein
MKPFPASLSEQGFCLFRQLHVDIYTCSSCVLDYDTKALKSLRSGLGLLVPNRCKNIFDVLLVNLINWDPT